MGSPVAQHFRRWLLGVLLLTAVGCGPGPVPELGIANGTDLTVSLLVNGEHVGTYEPGSGTTFPATGVSSLPWLVEARTSTGRVLASFTVQIGQVTSTTFADGHGESRSTGARVDLSCGRLDLWAGARPIGPAPDPNAGEPGDCEP